MQRVDGEDHEGLAPRARRRARGGGAAVARGRAHADRLREPRTRPARSQGARRAARRRRGEADEGGARLAARADASSCPSDVRAYLAARSAREARGARRRADAALERWREAHPERARGLGRGARAQRVPAELAASSRRRCSRARTTRRASTRAAVLQRLAARRAVARGRLGRPRRLEQHADREGARSSDPRRRRGQRPVRRPQPALRRARARDGRDRERHGPRRHLPALRRDVPRLQRLHAALDAPRGADEACARSSSSRTTASSSARTGPTHQPIEHLDAMRVIPGLTLFRPADGVETALAWAWTLREARGPVAFVLTRQKVPALRARAAGFVPEDVWRGAYAVREPGERSGVVLLATGSEVPLACAARRSSRERRRRGPRRLRCRALELFLAQPARGAGTRSCRRAVPGRGGRGGARREPAPLRGPARARLRDRPLRRRRRRYADWRGPSASRPRSSPRPCAGICGRTRDPRGSRRLAARPK